MIADIIINFVLIVLFESLAVAILILFRNDAIYKIRMKALDIVGKRLADLISDHKCSLEDIKTAYGSLDNLSYNEMLTKHLEKWKFEDFYPGLAKDEK